jgi:hypothetical protein
MSTEDIAALIRKVLEEQGYNLVKAGLYSSPRSERSQQLYVERTVNLANALVEHGVKL